MNFFRKLERKFGRFAIPNLMYYIIMMYAAGFVMSLFNPYFYVQYLALDAAAILRGQVWRIVTFLVCPPQSGVLFALLAMYLYYSIGSTLERVWGTFRFNMFFFMGVLGHIIAAFLVYGVTGFSVPMSPYYLNESLFLAFASLLCVAQRANLEAGRYLSDWRGTDVSGIYFCGHRRPTAFGRECS